MIHYILTSIRESNNNRGFDFDVMFVIIALYVNGTTTKSGKKERPVIPGCSD